MINLTDDDTGIGEAYLGSHCRPTLRSSSPKDTKNLDLDCILNAIKHLYIAKCKTSYS